MRWGWLQKQIRLNQSLERGPGAFVWHFWSRVSKITHYISQLREGLREKLRELFRSSITVWTAAHLIFVGLRLKRNRSRPRFLWSSSQSKTFKSYTVVRRPATKPYPRNPVHSTRFNKCECVFPKCKLIPFFLYTPPLDFSWFVKRASYRVSDKWSYIAFIVVVCISIGPSLICILWYVYCIIIRP